MSLVAKALGKNGDSGRHKTAGAVEVMQEHKPCAVPGFVSMSGSEIIKITDPHSQYFLLCAQSTVGTSEEMCEKRETFQMSTWSLSI